MKSIAIVSALSVFVFGTLSLAVQPVTVDQATEADFSQGELSGVGVSSLGEITLSRKTAVVLPSANAPSVVSSVVAVGPDIYVGSGGSGVIAILEAGKWGGKTVKLPSTLVSCLAGGKGLLAGGGGDNAGIYTLDEKGAPKLLWSDPAVKYVWAIVEGEGGELFAATGPGGAVYRIKDGKGEVIYKAPEPVKNILCLAKGKGLLYAGTDSDGLVVEINPAARTSRVLLDADEKEVAALTPDGAGGLYAATSDAAKASPDGGFAPRPDDGGKPELRKAVPAPASKPRTATTAGAAPKATMVISGADLKTMLAARAEAAAAPAPAEQGNAVYYIAPDGLVRTIFRRPVTILAMLLDDSLLTLGTGNGGDIYTVTTDGETVTRLSTDAKQVTALCRAGGALLFGTSNKGAVARLEPQLAAKGTFTSRPIDAKQIAKWGVIGVRAAVPAKASVTVATRTGNVAKPDDKTWGPWSAETPLGETPVGQCAALPVASPAGRFLQYRLTLSAGETSPVVQQVQAIYQVGNLAPQIAAVTVQAIAEGQEGPAAMMKKSRPGVAAQPSPLTQRQIQIKASDPNGDPLVYSLYFRAAGTANWIRLADKLTEPQYSWDTRGVGDGYYELKAIASDSPANPPGTALESSRVSSPVTVDNTPPEVKNLGAKFAAGAAAVSGAAADATSRIAAIHYSVDSSDEWTAVLPAGGICDSKKEEFAFEVKNLKPGDHTVTVRAADLYGNLGYATITVTAK